LPQIFLRHVGEWVNVGLPLFSPGDVEDVSVAIISGVPYVSFANASGGHTASLMKFNGTSWVAVGTAGYSSTAANNLSLAFNGTTPYVAFVDVANGGKVKVMKYAP